MINKLLNFLTIYPIIYIIKLYQYIISPILKINCRHLPTCSEYSISALKEHGLFIGIYYSCKRILSCHPFGGHGFDSVKKKNK
jgi:hypothetical protein